MITRTIELKALQSSYETSGNRIGLIYGSSRSQAREFVEEFCSDKDTLFYRARHASADKQVQMLGKEIENRYGISLSEYTYDECFKRLKSRDGSKLVLVIDEFELIAKKDEEFYKSIKKLKSGKLYPGPVMVILISTTLPWIKRDLEDCFGRDVRRIDLNLELKDLSFLEVVRSLPEYSVKEAVQTYGIVGGVPDYLDRWDSKRTVKENVCALFLDKKGIFFDEAQKYISGELRELSVYNTILSAMATGVEKLNDLFAVTGYSRAKISVYIKNLAIFDVVEKVVSFETGGWNNTKKGVYRISNHLIDFWFRFLYPNLSQLYTMKPEEFYDKYIEPGLDAYLRRYFIDVCKEYLELINRVGKVPVKIIKMGTWVGKNGTIDVVGEDAVRECAVGVTNWDEPQMSYDRYEKLLGDIKKAHISSQVIYLFSATAFDERLIKLADSDPSVVLVDMKEL